MRKLVKTTSVLAMVIALGASPTMLTAHDGAEGVVKERMHAMLNLGSAMKGIKANLKASNAAQNEALLLAATIIMESSGDHLNKLFPEGSDKAPSRAHPAIWEKKDQFDAISNSLQDASLALALKSTQALGKDDSGLKEGLNGERGEAVSSLANQPVPKIFKAIASTCGSCHQNFRMPK